MYRSGTTAFMRALAAGGIPLILPPEQRTTESDIEWRSQEISRSHLEPTGRMVQEYNYPLAYDDGCAVKMLWPGLQPTLHMMAYALYPDVSNGYRLAFLWRHPWEIRKAIENDFNWQFRDESPAHATVPWLTDGDQYSLRMQKMLEHYRIRRDVKSVYELQYRSNYRPDLPSLEHDALEIFQGLKAQGWPLDPAKAAATIDVQGRCRWRAEDIEEAA